MQERRQKIVEFVNQLGTVSFAQLKAAFPEVSDMTLRTDLKALDEERRLVRVHGGAKSVEVVVGTDDFLLRRAKRCAPEKAQIAHKALTLLRPDMTIYLDSGSLEEAKRFVLRYIEPAAKSAGERPFKDHKTMLQEIIQQNPGERLEYVLTGEHGPDHDKHFTVEVHLNSNVIGRGGGRSKKEAEQQAAREALELMGY